MTAVAVKDKRGPLEELIIDCLQKHNGTAPVSTVVGDLSEEVSKQELLRALRFLLQSGELRVSSNMELELAD